MAFLFSLALLASCVAQDQSTCNPPCEDNSFCINRTIAECECNDGYFSPDRTKTDCRLTNEPDPECSSYSTGCIYCGSSYSGPCLKCRNYVTTNGECVDTCSGTFEITIIPNTTLSARVCEVETSSESNFPNWAIIVIAVMSGLVILTTLVVLLVFAFTWFNKYSSGQFDVEDTNASLVETQTFGADSNQDSCVTNQDADLDDLDTGDEFYRKLAYLRNHAEVFLSMLNDMRRRLKEIPQDAPTAQQYRNVMRDVTRLLYLLNKRSSAIEIPPDGIQLLTWSEQILQRYMASQGKSPKEIAPKRLSSIGDQAETNF